MGFDWGRFLDVLKVVGPIALSAVNPVLGPVASVIVHAIGEAQQIDGATGPEKKAHVMNIADAAVVAYNGAAGKVVLDPAAVHEAADEGVDTVYAAIHVLVKTPATLAPALPGA